jgi:hypothetical protein
MRLRILARVGLLGLLCVGGLGAAEQLRLPDGTPIPVRLKDDLRSESVQVGDRVEFQVSHAVTIRGLIAIPEGALAWGAVQSVKKDKEIKFDLEQLRLPSLQQIKLRSVRKDTDNPGKDIIKVESKLGAFVGAKKGTEFVAYVDGDIEVAEAFPAAEAPAAAKSPSAAAPAPVRTTTPPAAPPTTPAQAATPAVTAAPAAVPSVPTTAPAPAETTARPTAPPATPAVTAAPAAAPSVPAVAPAPVRTTAPPAATATPAQVAAPASTAAPTAARSVPATAPAQPNLERVTVECFSVPTGAEILIDGDFHGHTPSILKLTATSHRLEYLFPGYHTFSQELKLMPGSGLSTVRAVLEKR